MRSVAFLLLIAVTFSSLSCGTSKPAPGTESYIAPGYQKKKYKSILVVGTMKDEVGRKKAESALVDLLNRSGYKGLPTYPVFSMVNIASREELKAKIETQKFDGIIVLQYLGAQTSISGAMNASSTTPIVSNWSFFDLYTSPAYDFYYESTSQKSAACYASFYTPEKYEKQWGSNFQVNASNGLDMATEALAGMVLARMTRDKIL